MTEWPRDWHGLKVAFTTSIPVEVPVAAGAVPMDLNNVFITSADPARLVAQAEQAGLPRTVCGWVKGIYAAALAADDLAAIIAVTQGDCSNTHALIELFQYQGKRVVPFAYPYDRSEAALAVEVEKLLRIFGVTYGEALEAKRRLDRIRRTLLRLDELTWKEGKVSGEENHRFLVSASDFNGDPDRFETEVEAFLREAEGRSAAPEGLRLGYLGVPPIWDDFYQIAEEANTRVVFNEMQRQFAMLPSVAPPLLTHRRDLHGETREAKARPTAETSGLVEGEGSGDESAEDALLQQYLRYTYPYDVFTRIEDIRREAHRRRLDGLIHYVQSFCFRQMEDLLLRKEVGLPVLTLEGDRPGPVDATTHTRIESFKEMLPTRCA